jgi:hypothetical protein
MCVCECISTFLSSLWQNRLIRENQGSLFKMADFGRERPVILLLVVKVKKISICFRFLLSVSPTYYSCFHSYKE